MYPDNPPSSNFSWAEAEITSHRRFDNTIPPSLYATIINTATGMEAVRTVLGGLPILVNSWYRSPAVNTAVGSKTNKSQHVKGEAVDFICPKYGSPLRICKELAAQVSFVNFDQLILEHNWVHISFVSPNVSPRNRVLTLLTGGKYAIGLTDLSGRGV